MASASCADAVAIVVAANPSARQASRVLLPVMTLPSLPMDRNDAPLWGNAQARLGETPWAERRDIDARRLIADNFGNNLSGHRRTRHADMAMSECVDHVARAARAADHRQRIRRARTMPHPH